MKPDPDDVPTLRGNDGILSYCHELGAVGVTPWRVKRAVIDREISPHQIGRQNWFSRNAVHRWLDSLVAPEPRIFMGVHAGRAANDPAAQS